MHPHRYEKHAATAHSSSTGPASMTADDKRRPVPTVTPDEIRLCAYRKWERAGKPAGDGLRFWLEAEHELTQGKK